VKPAAYRGGGHLDLVIIWFLTAQRIRTIDIFHSSLAGVVNDVYLDPRGEASILLEFQNTDKLNLLSNIYNSKVSENEGTLIKGDSIFKQMFTKGYDVYRKVDGEYVLLYHINSEK